MKFKILNTKTREEKLVTEYYVKNTSEFFNQSFEDNYISKKDFDEYLKNLDNDNEKKDFEEYWNNDFRYIIDDEVEYLKEQIEYTVWTSPTGVKSVYNVLDVIND